MSHACLVFSHLCVAFLVSSPFVCGLLCLVLFVVANLSALHLPQARVAWTIHAQLVQQTQVGSLIEPTQASPWTKLIGARPSDSQL